MNLKFKGHTHVGYHCTHLLLSLPFELSSVGLNPQYIYIYIYIFIYYNWLSYQSVTNVKKK